MRENSTDTKRRRSSRDNKIGGPIKLKWSGDQVSGQPLIENVLWAYVEWSEKRQEWCIEDGRGRCLKHARDLRGTADSKHAPIELAKQMIRDGRLPTPLEALERRDEERERRRQRPSEIRRHQEQQEPPGNLQTLGPSRDGRLQSGPPLIGWIGFTGAFRLVLDWPAMTGTRTLRSDEPLAVELTAAPKQGEVNRLRRLLARTLGPPSDNNGFRGSTARPRRRRLRRHVYLPPRPAGKGAKFLS